MKKIEAYIRPFKVEELKAKLLTLGITELRFFPVKEWSEGKIQEFYSGNVFEVDYVARTMLIMLVEDESVNKVIEAIQQQCSTNAEDESIRDGIVFVIPVEKVVKL